MSNSLGESSSATTEPTVVGTIVRCSNGEEMMLVKVESPNPWWHLNHHAWCNWGGIEPFEPVIVHEGYTPSTPEPTRYGARVIDASNERCIRVRSYATDDWPWRTESGAHRDWHELAHPVRVISDGSDW